MAAPLAAFWPKSEHDYSNDDVHYVACWRHIDDLDSEDAKEMTFQINGLIHPETVNRIMRNESR